MTDVHHDQLFVQSPQVCQRSTGEWVVVSAVGSEVVELEGPAVSIWALLQQPHSLDQILQALGEQFSVDPVSIRDEVVGVVRRLVDEKLVRNATADQPGVVHGVHPH